MVQIKSNLDYEILLLLIRERMYLRAIARALNTPHSTIIRKINGLLGYGVIDYIQEGKNKIYFIKKSTIAKQYVYQAEMYKLIRLITIYPELEVLIKEILESTDEQLIVLFGSYAKFSAKKESDIDLYICSQNNSLIDKLTQINSKISIKLGKFDTNSNLIKEIINNHIILRGEEVYYEQLRFFK